MYTPPATQLVDYLQRLYDFGMTTTSGGNLSILDSDGVIWITPSGIDKGSLRPRDIMKMLPDGTAIGLHRPSVEFPFHRHIYQIRPDARAVLHAHTASIVAFSCVGRIPDVRLIPGAEAVCGNVVFAKYAIPGSEELGDILAKAFQDGADAVIMENHGAVVCGASMEECFLRYEALATAAAIELEAAGLGKTFDLVGARPATKWPVFKPGEPSSDECELRAGLANFHARCYRQRLFHTGNAFIAARLGADDFLASPEGIDPLNAEPADFVRIADGRRETGKIPGFPSAAAREIFRAHDWARAVYLTRAPHIMAYATTGAPFDSRTIPESFIQLRDVPVVKAADFYADPADVAARVAPRTPVLLVESVGLLTVGKTLIEGFDRMEVGEFTARCCLLAARLGTLTPMTQSQVRDVVKVFKLPR